MSSTGIAGKYFSGSIVTSSTDEDLIKTLKTLTGENSLTIQKMTLITTSNIHLKVGASNVYSTLYLNADGNYALSLDSNDVLVSTLIIKESGTSLFIASVYN